METIKNAFIHSISEVLSMFGLETTYDGETSVDRVESSSQVNILIGLTVGAGGSMILGMDKPMALHLASTMMCGMEVQELDDMSKAALGEIMNMIMGNFLTKVQTDEDKIIDISPPTVVSGDRVSILLSKIKAHRLLLHLGEHKYHITFSIQQ